MPQVREASAATVYAKARPEHAPGGQRRKHACPYCSADKAKTYSTFLDWKHLSDTQGHCMESDDPLWQEEYTAGFKLDRCGRFHELEGSETDRAYQRVRTLRKHYGRYQGPGEGEPQGPPSTILLPHTKGTTPDRDTTLTESELAGSEHGESGQEEGEVTQGEGDDPGSFTQMKSRDTDTKSEDTTPGQDSWRSARGREVVLLTTPRTRGRRKRRGGGTTKRPREVVVIGAQGRVRGVQVRWYSEQTGTRWQAGCSTHDAPAPSSTAEH